MALFHFLTALLATAACGRLASAARVQLGNTTVVGVDYPDLHEEFYGGIPFASPPVGSLRFKRPVPQFDLGNATTFNATQYGPSCVQTGFNLSISSEDCLTLNVFRPAGIQPNASLPVMVWIFGGGFQGGDTVSANASQIVARSMARGTPIVYVSLNYRVAAFGFPKAMRRQLQAFGGDPMKVTVFGASAGSMSISHHYLNNLTAVARGAIFESGWAPTLPLFNASHFGDMWYTFANSTPTCQSSPSFSHNNTLPCLLDAPTEEILEALSHGLFDILPNFFLPVLDGPSGIIPDYPTVRVQATDNRMPIMSGTVLDDGTAFTPPFDLDALITTLILKYLYEPSPVGADLDTVIQEVLALYPEDAAVGSPYFTGNNTFGLSAAYKQAAAMVTDLAFLAPRRFFGQTAASQGSNVYSYMFTEQYPSAAAHDGHLGVSHGSEVAYVYGSLESYSTPRERALSNTIMDYWISFVTSLTPNDGKGSQRPNWETYNASNPRIMQLNTTDLGMVQDDFHRNQSDFLNLNRAHLAFSQ